MSKLSSHNLQKVGVLPNKFLSGLNKLTDNAPLMPVRDFKDAMETPWNSDAHFCCYLPEHPSLGDLGQQGMPRLNKSVLPHMKLAGGSIKATMVVVEYDNHTCFDHATQQWVQAPDKQPWTQELLQAFYDFFYNTVGPQWPLSLRFSVMYTTRNGIRLIYRLRESVDVEHVESRVAGMIDKFTRLGIPMDPACADWTRLFRSAYVVRDGRPTWNDPMFQYIPQYDNCVDIEELPQVITNSTALAQNTYQKTLDPIQDDKPSPEDCTDILRPLNPDTDRHVQSKMFRSAKRLMKGTESFDIIFNEAEIAPSAGPGRNEAIIKYVGEAIAKMARVPGVTAPFIYALFIDSVCQLTPDSDTPDWTDILWSAVTRLWQKEAGKIEQQNLTAKAEADQALDEEQTMAEIMKTWCNHPLLHDADIETALKWARQHYIVSHGSHYWIINKNGYFSDHCLSRTQLIPHIKRTGMDSLIQVNKLGDTGLVDRRVDEVLSDHCTVAQSIECIPGMPGGSILNPDKNGSVFRISTYRRNPLLKAEYSPDVDEWLRVLAGSEKNYNHLENWLSYAPAFDEGPICALSLAGAAGSGKGMLAQGLAELLEVPELATADDLVGDYQGGLRKSPYIMVDEGWPGTKSRSGRHAADQFRTLVAGDIVPVNEKYEPVIKMRIYPRILMFANNLSVVQTLTANRNLSPDDREALNVRLLHMSVGSNASRLLYSKGGRRYTGAAGARWVAGSDGKSDFVLARHILYLYENRNPVTAGRFQVSGNYSDEVAYLMQTRSGHTPLVIEALLRMFEMENRPEGVVVHNSRLFVLQQSVLKFYREIMRNDCQEKMTHGTVQDVLKGLVVQENLSPFVLPEAQGLGRRRWHEIDVALIIKVAQTDGFKCAKLERLHADQVALGLSKEIG